MSNPIKNLGNIMKQAQELQSKLADIQEQMAKKTIQASLGGGMVTATVNGKQELLSISIDPIVVESKDLEMLQDLIVAAVNEAMKRSQEMMAEEMGKLTGGLKIPGLSL